MSNRNTAGTSFDPEQYKAMQRQTWDNVAQGWLRWWETFERGAQKISDRMVEMAEIKPGYNVLDLATGIGEPAITAAKHTKPSGRVLATDISAKMLEIARQRAALFGLQDIIEFKESDAEVLDLHDSAFDAVLSRWGLMFFPNLDATLEKVYKTLVPGRILSAAVWSVPSKVPLLDLPFSTVRRQINAAPPPKGIPGPFSLADENSLRHSFSQAGFTDVRSEKLTVTFSFSSAEDFTRFHQSITAPIHAMMSNQTGEKKKEIWNAVTDAVKQYARSDGRVDLENEVICVVGKR